MSESNGNGKRKHSDDEENDDLTNGGGENGVVSASKKIKASKEAGTMLFAGLTDYNKRHMKSHANTEEIVWTAHRYKSLEGVRIRDVASHGVAYHALAISEDGKVYAWGFNKNGQLGVGDNVNRRNPTLVESMEEQNVVQVAVGRFHSLMLTDTGHVYACGENSEGQCGIGKRHPQANVPLKVDTSEIGPIKMVSCGEKHSLFVSEDGTLHSCGNPEFGVLGHGTEGKELGVVGKSGRVTFHYEYVPKQIESFIEKDEGETIPHGQPHIVYVSSGIQHNVAIDDQQRAFSWGHGGFGRLGHNSTANELVPRLMKCWFRITGRADGGVTKVWCGGQFNIVDTTVDKCKYMFGQYNTSKEANMYPKFMDDLQGWNTRDVACGQSGFLICADDVVIGAQPSPGFGSLAAGTVKKASAPPMFLTAFKDLYMLRTGLGYAHACYIARDSSEKDKAVLENFPTLEFEEATEEAEDEPVETKKGKGGKTASAKGGKAAAKTNAKKKKVK